MALRGQNCSWIFMNQLTEHICPNDLAYESIRKRKRSFPISPNKVTAEYNGLGHWFLRSEWRSARHRPVEVLIPLHSEACAFWGGSILEFSTSLGNTQIPRCWLQKTQCPDSKMKRKASDNLKKKTGLSFNLHFYKKWFLNHNMAP